MHPYRPVDPFGRRHAMIYHSRPQNMCGPFKANACKSKGSRTGTSLRNYPVRKFCRASCTLLPTITWITVEKDRIPRKKWSFQNGTWTHDKSTPSKFEHHQPIQLKQLLLASASLLKPQHQSLSPEQLYAPQRLHCHSLRLLQAVNNKPYPFDPSKLTRPVSPH